MTMRRAFSGFASAIVSNYCRRPRVKLSSVRGVATKIDGKAIAKEIRREIGEVAETLTRRYNKKPGLA